MSERPAPALHPSMLPRFSWAERAVHWTFAALMTVCILSAAVLYNGSLAIIVGHRHAVELIHVYCGFALPVPLLLGAVSAAYRADLRRVNRFAPADWQWLRSRQRRDGTIRVGKFNAGQKLNASFQLGGILMMLSTGLVMRFANHWPVYLRTGATFVHDWMAYAILAVVLGHLWMANRDPDALRGMRTGYVRTSWARREHEAWANREAARAKAAGATGGSKATNAS
jgi:formate dehydrogenase subunit gamma